MLAKKFRLEAGSIIYLSKTKSLRGDYFILRARKNNLGFSRFGIIISRRAEKSAARRNKMKRIIFELIRLNKLYLSAGYDFLIIMSAQSFRSAKEEVKNKLTRLLREITNH